MKCVCVSVKSHHLSSSAVKADSCYKPPYSLSVSWIISCNTLFLVVFCLALQRTVYLIWMNWAKQSRARLCVSLQSATTHSLRTPHLYSDLASIWLSQGTFSFLLFLFSLKGRTFEGNFDKHIPYILRSLQLFLAHIWFLFLVPFLPCTDPMLQGYKSHILYV